MLKEKKNFLNNIMFISIMLLIIMEITEKFITITYFSEITKVLSVVTVPIIMIILGVLIREDKDDKKDLFKKGFLIYFILQIINMLIVAIMKGENPGYFMFTPYYIDWVFIAIPIYTIILEKLGKEKHILFITTVIALCLTIDGSINSDLICKLIMYLPFFVLGWKYEKETENIPSGKMMIIVKIFALILLTIAFQAIDTKNVIISSVKTTENAVEITTLKLMLYATSAIAFSLILDLFSNVKLLNKEYKFNYENVLILGPIVNNILLETGYTTYIKSTYSIILIVLTGILITLLLAYIPFEKIVNFLLNKIKIRKENKKNKKEEKLRKKGKLEEERLIIQPDGLLTKLINSNVMVIILGVFTLLKLIMFYNHTVYSKIPIPQYEIWYNASFILIFLIPLLLINNNRIRYIALLIWDIVISTVLFADELYFSYSSMAISLNQAGNIRYFKEILDTVKYLIEPRQIFYFVDIILFIVLVKITTYKNVKRGSKDRNFKNIIVALLIIYMCIGNIVTLCLFVYNAPYNNQYQISEGTIFGYHLNDIRSFFNVKAGLKYKSKDEINSAYKELKNYYDENYKIKYEGAAKGKNIIVLQLESIQEFLYKAKINGKEITPNLNKFLDENIHLTNMHSQSYTSTADSEFSVQTSMYPLENGLSFSKYYNVEYDDLFSLMTKNDYYTSYIHGNVGSFWNRDKVYTRFNIDEINFIEDFHDTSELIMGYLSDELLYKQTVEKLEKYEEPFFVNILSASSHTGFTLDGLDEKKKEEILTIDVGDYKNTPIGNYLESVNYADIQFGMFIDELKKDGLYDDTVIFIFGDHYGLREEEPTLNQYLQNDCGITLNEVQKKINFTNVMAGIHIPGFKHMVIDKPVSKIDIKPTILSLAGIKDEEDISLGMSIFSNKEYASTNEGTIITKDMYYDSKKWYYIKSNEEVNLDLLDEEQKEKLNEFVNNLDIELGISNAVPVLYKIEGEEIINEFINESENLEK